MRLTSYLVLLSLLLFGMPRAGWALFGSTPRPEIGDAAPSFRAPLLRGGEFNLQDHLGRDAVLLDFWSIYCVSCIQAMPKLAELHDRYAAHGFTVVGVNLDSFSTKRVARFVAGLEFTIPFPLALDKDRKVAAAFGVSVLPTSVLVGRDGTVVRYHIGYAAGDEEHLEADIRRALEFQP